MKYRPKIPPPVINWSLPKLLKTRFCKRFFLPYPVTCVSVIHSKFSCVKRSVILTYTIQWNTGICASLMILKYHNWPTRHYFLLYMINSPSRTHIPTLHPAQSVQSMTAYKLNAMQQIVCGFPLNSWYVVCCRSGLKSHTRTSEMNKCLTKCNSTRNKYGRFRALISIHAKHINPLPYCTT